MLALLLLVLAGLTVFVIDPLQQYRRATLYHPLWEGNLRYYDPGFVKHYDYDCIIIGSSMVQNFIPSEVGKQLSARVLVASIGAGSPYEEGVLLNTALRTGKVKTVIWGLDVNVFGMGTRALSFGPGTMPFYLYDDNPFNDYHYLWNIDVLLTACGRTLAANILHTSRWHRELNPDSAQFVADRFTFSREAALADLKRVERERPGTLEARRRELEHPETAMTGTGALDSMKRNLEVNVMPLVERHPEVTYNFFYPPYSILFWTVTPYPLETLLEFKRYVFMRTRGLPNVKVFDFQDIGEITLNLNNYMDYSHYSPAVSKFIINAISKNQYVVNDDNIEEKLSRLESQVREFSDSLAAAEGADSTGAARSAGTGQTGCQEGEVHEP